MPVAATLLLTDPRQIDRTAYLVGFRFVNDTDVLDRFLATIMEEVWRMGCRRLVGPVDFSPNMGAGVLHDHFNTTPPFGTPYSPPYVAEAMDAAMRPLGQSHLYQKTVVEIAPPLSHDGPAILLPIQPRRLADDLFPVFFSGFTSLYGLPVPDQAEATFLLAWATSWPIEAWLATVNAEAVGFIMLQPDLSDRIRRANGGRNPLWREWLHWRQSAPANAGRVLYLGVIDHWRGKGIGRQLWQHALAVGHAKGWQELVAGPVADGSNAVAFLKNMGATRRQRYTTYYLDI
jgi:GNAT superfamily N-acetyltransferase